MRHRRRGGGSGLEFGGSGEDSFVAVVVTEAHRGPLLFILLLTMVIVAILPKAVDMAPPGSKDRGPGLTASLRPRWRSPRPRHCPEAIAGRPYAVALAANGRPRAAAMDAGRADPRRALVRPCSGHSSGHAEQGDSPAAVAGRPGQRQVRRSPPARLGCWSTRATSRW